MIQIPGRPGTFIRMFDRVEAQDSQYDIVDFGVQYEDGSIDSIAVGGSFASLKKAIRTMNDNAVEERELDQKIAQQHAAVSTPDPVEPPAPAATKFDGTEQDIEGL